MKINLIVIGKTGKKFLEEGEQEYLNRLKHYTPFAVTVIPDIKNAKNKTQNQLKEEEGKLILDKIEAGGIIVLLDENGKQYGSVEFANWIQDRMNRGIKHITFVVGGPYGFSDEVYNKANEKLSLSRMTFSHQMIRMLFLEQLYRGFTILKNEPYHHE
ncbi:MAG: 23S rRNA (pseudouridine(1915)-N(3))-methyltransferase RlmH [Crocinitomicaceae bacterium]|nr:23S rRNA (pseudouridine(1915)-N(3))-methyltransferase RlmH [Crocinitomicaceae bacterium]